MDSPAEQDGAPSHTAKNTLWLYLVRQQGGHIEHITV